MRQIILDVVTDPKADICKSFAVYRFLANDEFTLHLKPEYASIIKYNEHVVREYLEHLRAPPTIEYICHSRLLSLLNQAMPDLASSQFDEHSDLLIRLKSFEVSEILSRNSEFRYNNKILSNYVVMRLYRYGIRDNPLMSPGQLSHFNILLPIYSTVRRMPEYVHIMSVLRMELEDSDKHVFDRTSYLRDYIPVK